MRPVDLPADLLFAEAQSVRLHGAPPALTVGARYSFKNWFDKQGKLREFSCRLTEISPVEMGLIVPVNGRKGAAVTVECEEFGQLEGTVSRPTNLGFTMQIDATDEERAKLAHKIAWHEKFQKKRRPTTGRTSASSRTIRCPLSSWPTAAARDVSSSTCRFPASRCPPK